MVMHGRHKGLRLALGIMSLLAVILWMRVIYGFSGQNGTESTAVSNDLSGRMVRIIDRVLGKNKSPEEIQLLANQIETWVRKAAHGFEYSVLALLLYAHLSIYGISLGTKAFLSWFISTAYAFTDEWHQTAVAGRSASIEDIIIDSVGAALVLFVILIMAANRQSRKVWRLEEERWELKQRQKAENRRRSRSRRDSYRDEGRDQ